MPQGVLILAAVSLVFIIVGCWMLSIDRTRKLAAWAAGRGLKFDHRRNGDMDKRYPFKCLTQGDDRYAYNVSSGVIGGREVEAFDYHYRGEVYNSQKIRRFSAVAVKSDFPLKPLLIRREDILDKISGFLGADDINFESAEFSRKFFVNAGDKKWAYDIIHQRMMEFLLESPKFAIEFRNMHVLVWRMERFRAADFDAAVAFAAGVLNLIPEYVAGRQT